MCFEKSVKLVAFADLMATHPPIGERIKAIDREIYKAYVESAEGRIPIKRRPAPAPRPVSEAAPPGVPAFGAAIPVGVAAASLLAGSAAPAHVDWAASLLASLPQAFKSALGTARGAVGAVYILLLPEGAEDRQKALELVQMREGGDMASFMMKHSDAVRALGPMARLPILDLALPALRELTADEARAVIATAEGLAAQDRTLSVFEYCLLSLLRKHLLREAGGPDKVRFRFLKEVSSEAGLVVHAFAHAGEGDTFEGYRSAMVGLGLEPVGRAAFSRAELRALDGALYKLSGLAPKPKRSLLDACSALVVRDGRVTASEYELIRAVFASLDVPMPPLLGQGA
jgi:hypothetical protein